MLTEMENERRVQWLAIKHDTSIDSLTTGRHKRRGTGGNRNCGANGFGESQRGKPVILLPSQSCNIILRLRLKRHTQSREDSRLHSRITWLITFIPSLQGNFGTLKRSPGGIDGQDSKPPKPAAVAREDETNEEANGAVKECVGVQSGHDHAYEWVFGATVGRGTEEPWALDPICIA
ncbi:hypothetical protein BC832DRAFT_538539 [Gaertneriomyces semiglobifer]|nr:hypothetical protein BC832DRAFT_538539 [Gaertneriomyces semiglobifer]